MVAIICTIIICATVLLCVHRITNIWKPEQPVQQQGITEEDLAKAYQDAEKVPDFQDVINFINKEFTGVTEDGDEG